ncbi:hypothetical protein Emag_006280 [Eimeria magna]
MAGLKFIVLAAALLLLLEDGGALGSLTSHPESPSPAETVTHTGERVDCLEAMNAARKEVGLPDFVKGEEEGVMLPIRDKSANLPSGRRLSAILRTGLPDASPGSKPNTEDESREKEFLKEVCEVVLKDSGEQKCAAAVEKWRGVVNHFPSTPPIYPTNESFYQNQENLSVIGLFNPKSDPKVDCAVITCQTKTSNDDESEPGADAADRDSASTDETPKNEGVQQDKNPVPGVSVDSDNREDLNPESARSSNLGSEGASPSQTTPVYSLLCISSPEVLQDNEAPFS